MERRLRVILSQPCLGKGEKVSNSFQHNGPTDNKSEPTLAQPFPEAFEL